MRITILLMFLGFTNSLLAQISPSWVICTDIDTFSYASVSLNIDHSGNIYTTGYKGAAQALPITSKYSQSGELLWTNTFSATTPFGSVPIRMAVDNDSNIYLACNTSYYVSNKDYLVRNNITIIKYNTSGQQQWVTQFGLSDSLMYVSDMVVDSFGNLYIAGYSYVDTLYPVQYLLTAKFNSTGKLLWADTNNLRGSAHYITVDPKGNAYSAGVGTNGILTVKYNNEGDTIWLRNYNNILEEYYFDQINKIILDDKDNLYEGIDYTGFNHYGQTKLIKYSSGGKLLWDAGADSTNAHGRGFAGRSMMLDKNSNTFIYGEWIETNDTSYARLIKFDSTGKKDWGLNLPSRSSGNSMSLDSIGNVYISCVDSGGSEKTFVYESKGELIETALYKEPNSIITNPDVTFAFSPHHLLVLAFDVFSLSHESGNECLIDFSNLTGIHSSPGLNTKIEIFPNPTSQQITVSLPSIEIGEIQIINILGETVFSEKLNTATEQIDVSRFPAGMYLLTVSDSHGISENKFLNQ